LEILNVFLKKPYYNILKIIFIIKFLVFCFMRNVKIIIINNNKS